MALTEALPRMVNVHDFTLLPPLEQAPDQIALRPFDTVSVIDVPVVNVAEPVLPTATLIPAGLEVTPSPFRPVAVTDSVADCAGGGGGGGVAGGFTDNVAVLVAPPKAPPIVRDVAAVTPVVATPKFALVAPAATVTLAGTPATVVLLLDSVTTAPPAGAAAVKVTVPVLEAPPTTLVGLTVTADKVGDAGTGLTVKVAARVRPPKVAEIAGAVEAVTAFVVIGKVAVVAPAATVTLAGTVAAAVLELLRLTTAPPAGAPAVRVTVPCDEFPPTTEVGDTLTVDKLATGGGGAAARAVKRRMDENDPATPAELTARTRQKSCWAGRPVIVACDALTV